MTQTSNRFFDEIGRLMNDAAGAAQGVKREVDTLAVLEAKLGAHAGPDSGA
jgi:BMFP domain-containing protein YqiC